jgi:RimJ/RimL family protein N-acetyltransferase
VDDAEAMTGVLDDPALYRFTGGEPPALDALRRRYAAQVVGVSPDGSERWLNWIVRLGDPDTGATGQAGTPIGFVQATVVLDGRRADVAWVIGVPWQGAGYAAEAAAALVAWLLASGVVDVSAHVHPDHEASGRVAARAGRIPTGTIEDGEQLWRLPAEPPPA